MPQAASASGEGGGRVGTEAELGKLALLCLSLLRTRLAPVFSLLLSSIKVQRRHPKYSRQLPLQVVGLPVASRDEMPPRLPRRRLCSAAATSANAAPAPKPRRERPSQLRSKRRLVASPLLPPEAVALAPAVQAHVERLARAMEKSPRDIRKTSRAVERGAHAGAIAMGKLKRVRGAPRVAAVADYRDAAMGLSELVTRGPHAIASLTYVMAELRRCRPRFMPRSMLDFGAGAAPAVSAAGRVFRRNLEAGSPASGVDEGSVSPTSSGLLDEDDYDAEQDADNSREFQGIGRPELDWKLRGKSSLDRVVLVDNVGVQRDLGLGILAVDQAVEGTKNLAVGSLRDVPGQRRSYDLVSASYALSDVARSVMSEGSIDDGDGEFEEGMTRPRREAVAERHMRRIVKDLWSRVAPGGALVLVEHGTLAGFETILFARETILRGGHGLNPEEGPEPVAKEATALSDTPEEEDDTHRSSVAQATTSADDAEAALSRPRVVAPCLHSEVCPLQRTATRARVCRFVQRLNRPLFLRNTVRRPFGHEDTHFSYIVIERPDSTALVTEESPGNDKPIEKEYWGRLVRDPLKRGKHVVLDACTSEGTLERRVSSKKNGAPGMYAIARKVRWGDVWPHPAPTSKPQIVTF